jgi:hypothetical protein
MVFRPYSNSSAGWAISLLSGGSNTWFVSTTSSSFNARNYKGNRAQSVSTAAQLWITSGNSSNLYSSINGVDGTSGSTANTPQTYDGYSLGYNGGTVSQGIYLFEWLHYNKELTPTENTNVVNYLKTKYSYSGW